MGESFMGFPSKLRAYGERPTDFNYNSPMPSASDDLTRTTYPVQMDKEYHPNHAFSAYYGYLMSKLYLNRVGGEEFAMSGPLFARDIIPKSHITGGVEKIPDIGTKDKPYNKIYAKEFIGNAGTASSLSASRNIKVSLQKTDNDRNFSGNADFDGTKDIEISVWAPFLHINGGTVNGETTFGSFVTFNSNVTINGYNTYTHTIEPAGLGIVKSDQVSVSSATVGSYKKRFVAMYAQEFIGSLVGNANTATKFEHPVKITVDVDSQHTYQGSALLNGNEGNGSLGSGTPTLQGITIQTAAKGYLPTTGGTVTGDVEMQGQVKGKGGGSYWYNGRDTAAFRNSVISGYTPLTSMKSGSGSWEFGAYGENAHLTYISDYNYQNAINTVGASNQFIFYSDGTFSANKLQGNHTGTFTGSATFTENTTVLAGKGLIFKDKNDRLALKIWCGDDGDGNVNRFLHFSCAENEGWIPSKCFFHFDRAYGVCNSRKPFKGDNGLLGTLYNPRKAEEISSVIVGDVDEDGNPKPEYFGYELGPGVKINDELKAFIPTTRGTLTLGADNRKWKNVWATNAVIQTSDRNLKEKIRKIPDVFKKVYTDFLPIVYHWINSEENGYGHDRQHTGFISQDIEYALEKHGLTSMDFSGLCINERHPLKENPFYRKTDEEIIDYINKHPEFNDEDVLINKTDKYLDEEDTSKEKTKQYSLRLDQFVPLNTFMIQELMAKVDHLEVLAGLKDDLDYPELVDPHRYACYDKK